MEALSGGTCHLMVGWEERGGGWRMEATLGHGIDDHGNNRDVTSRDMIRAICCVMRLFIIP